MRVVEYVEFVRKAICESLISLLVLAEYLNKVKLLKSTIILENSRCYMSREKKKKQTLLLISNCDIYVCLYTFISICLYTFLYVFLKKKKQTYY